MLYKGKAHRPAFYLFCLVLLVVWTFLAFVPVLIFHELDVCNRVGLMEIASEMYPLRGVDPNLPLRQSDRLPRRHHRPRSSL